MTETAGATRSVTPRLVGLDVARCLALLGMVATHVLAERDADGTLSFAHELAGGRASALFALLAGVGVALATGGRTPPARDARRSARRGLAVRALLVAVAGLLLGQLDTGLAVILTYYGLLFLCALPFLALRARALLVLGTAWVAAGPVLSLLVRPHLPARGYENPVIAQLEHPVRLLSELLFTGYYPVVPWVAYLLVGMGVGRLDLRARRVQAAIAGVGAVVAVLVPLLSDALVRRREVARALVADPPGVESSLGALRDSIAAGMYGNTPTGTWAWLLVDAPHSSTPFDLARTLGSGLLVVGLALLVVGALPAFGRVVVAVLAGAGTMTLSLYSLHVVMRTEAVWPDDHGGSDVYLAHVLVLLAIGAVTVALGRRGPLEAVVAAASRAARGRTAAREPVSPSAG